MKSNDLKKYYVYAWWNNETGDIFYIGKGSGNRRFTKKRENNRFNEIVNKYRCSSEIIIDGLTEQEALDCEREAIEIAKNKGCPLVNKFEGGRQPPTMHGRVFSDETKKKMSDSMNEFYKNHPEVRKESSERMKRFLKTEKGKEFQRKSIESRNNDEFRRLQSERCRKANTTPEYIERQSKIVKEMWKSEAYAEAHRGANNCRSQGVKQYDLGGNFIAEYETITQAWKETGVNFSKISAVCRGKRKTAGGYKWEYTNDKHQTCSKRNYVYNPDNYRKISKPVLQFDMDMNFIAEYHSINDVYRKNPQFSRNGISQNLKGKTRHAYGYIWKLKQDNPVPSLS